MVILGTFSTLIITTDCDILGSKVNVKLVAKLSNTNTELQECHQTLFSLHFVENTLKCSPDLEIYVRCNLISLFKWLEYL